MAIGLRLRTLRDELLSSLWFRPTLIAGGAGLLAIGSLTLDQQLQFKRLLLSPGADDARAILSSITSSMLTGTTVTFSTIIVALVLASQQFSPRLLRNFMRDKASQYVVGTFLGTFIFSLLVLGRVSDTNNVVFVPKLSLLISVILAILSMGMFLYFVHHIAETILVNNIIAQAAKRTDALIDQRFPLKGGADPAAPSELPAAEPLPVHATRAGYVQAVDAERLIALATEHDLLIRMDREISDFVPEGTALACYWSMSTAAPTVAEPIRDAFVIDVERSLLDDVLFGVRQLVDVAVKAMSPAVNDPTTANTCVDFLGNILVQAARRPDPFCYYHDADGRLRLIAKDVSFERLVDDALNQIRQYASGDVSVVMRMLKILKEVAQVTGDPKRRAVLWRHARMIARAADAKIHEPYDRQQINERVRRLAAMLDQPPGQALLRVDESLL